MPGRKRGKMGDLAHQAALETDAMLADEEAAMLVETTIDLQSLRPRITDKATFDRLVAAVEESTRKNESIAQLKARIEMLGKATLTVAKEVISLLPK